MIAITIFIQLHPLLMRGSPRLVPSAAIGSNAGKVTTAIQAPCQLAGSRVNLLERNGILPAAQHCA